LVFRNFFEGWPGATGTTKSVWCAPQSRGAN
jgi:hypothetical protein